MNFGFGAGKTRPNMKRFVGLRNIVTNSQQWKYLVLYDIDIQEEGWTLGYPETCEVISERHEFSYIHYSTKHGSHLVGLTPLDARQWSEAFLDCAFVFRGYYSGQTLRLTRKDGERQKLISMNLDYPVMPNLYNIFAKRFGLEHMETPNDAINHPSKWHLVFEKYWTDKL